VDALKRGNIIGGKVPNWGVWGCFFAWNKEESGIDATGRGQRGWAWSLETKKEKKKRDDTRIKGKCPTRPKKLGKATERGPTYNDGFKDAAQILGRICL